MFMIAPRGRLDGAALLCVCVIAITSPACNAVFGLGPIEGSTGAASATDAGSCASTSASGGLTISNGSSSFPSFTVDLADKDVRVASGYDAVLDQSSFTIKTLKVPDRLCSASVTIVIAGEPITGRAYTVVSTVSDPRFAMDRDAWVKLDVDDDTAAMCEGPARWEPGKGLDQSLTVETFDGSSVGFKLSQVKLEGVVNASGWITIDGNAQSSCFGAR
jgi:hypothetical protein